MNNIYIKTEGETLEEAIKDHFCPYFNLEHAIKDASSWMNEGEKFSVYNNDRKLIGNFIIKEKKAEELPLLVSRPLKRET